MTLAGVLAFRERLAKQQWIGVAAILALIYYFILPFDLITRQTLVILSFSPVSTATPGFTADLGEDAGLSSAINSISIICSIVITITLLLIML